MERFEVRTQQRSQMIDVTDRVQAIVSRLAPSKDTSGGSGGSGGVTVFVPHTTAAVTINENADPDVVHDFLRQLDEMVPWEQPFYRHAEGNSAAHVKASMMGSSVTVLIESAKLQLGTWQGIWLCEFDGPRTREVWVRIYGGQ